LPRPIIEAVAPNIRSQPYIRDTFGVGVTIVHDRFAPKGYYCQECLSEQQVTGIPKEFSYFCSRFYCIQVFMDVDDGSMEKPSGGRSDL
jgi:hypothetical protein